MRASNDFRRLSSLGGRRLAELLWDYCRRRGFAASLSDRLARLMHISLQQGDGSLYSDSLLALLLDEPGSRVRDALDWIPDARSSISLQLNMANTFTTSSREIVVGLQDSLDTLVRQRRIHDRSLIDENELLAIEIEEAVEEYGDSHYPIFDFAAEITEAFYMRSRTERDRTLIDRFQAKLERALVTGFFFSINPLDLFATTPPQSKIRDFAPYQDKDGKWLARVRRFLFYLRDSVRVSALTIRDDDLLQAARKWEPLRFHVLCHEVADSDFDLDGTSKDLQYNGLFASARLRAADVPLAVLQRFLRGQGLGPDQSLWDPSEKLMFYLVDGGRIKTAPIDSIGRIRLDQQTPNGFGLGFPVPNPIWNEAVIDRLEYMINQPSIKEAELQVFFEMYPQFILDDLHVTAIPQVTLAIGSGGRPDFVLQRADSVFVDILEIKRPDVGRLITGTSERPMIVRELQSALSQLRSYGEWFHDRGNRTSFRDRYGLDGYEPRLTLVIGRRSSFPCEETTIRALSPYGIRIVTYDDLVSYARLRRKRLGLD